jgi:hypothetical protein
MNKEQKRLNDINKILKYYKEPDVPDEIINKIKKKYPILKYYEYIHTEQIQQNDIIQMVNLDFKHISIKGKCIKINYSRNYTIDSILLYNNLVDIYWKINPTKYYVFKTISKNDEMIRKQLDNIYKNKKI